MTSDLHETQQTLQRSIDGLLERGEKLTQLEEKSGDLVRNTRMMSRDIEWRNASLLWKALHYVNIFRLCYTDAW